MRPSEVNSFGTWFKYIVAGVALLAIVTTLNGFWLASARILYSMGKARILPAWFDNLNKKDVPSHATWVILGVCIFFMVASGTNWLPALLALMATGLASRTRHRAVPSSSCAGNTRNGQRPWKLPVGQPHRRAGGAGVIGHLLLQRQVP